MLPVMALVIVVGKLEHNVTQSIVARTVYGDELCATLSHNA